MFLKLPFAVSFGVLFITANTRYFGDHLERLTHHYVYIYIYNTAVLINICRFFLINVVKLYANPYEIGPSNTSQGQHRRKDATEYIKNLTHPGPRLF